MGSGSFVEFHDSVSSKQDDELLLRHRRALLRRAYPQAPRARWVSGMSTRWVDWSHSGIYNFKFWVPVVPHEAVAEVSRIASQFLSKASTWWYIYIYMYDANVFGESYTYYIQYTGYKTQSVLSAPKKNRSARTCQRFRHMELEFSIWAF